MTPDVITFLIDSLILPYSIRKSRKLRIKMEETFNRAMQASRDNNLELFNFYYGEHVKLFNKQ